MWLGGSGTGTRRRLHWVVSGVSWGGRGALTFMTVFGRVRRGTDDGIEGAAEEGADLRFHCCWWDVCGGRVIIARAVNGGCRGRY